jgi:hypothetical protein
MDEMLFPEEALAFLRQTQYDPGSRRGFECLSTSFHWSDERLPQAIRVCRNHGSRATFYSMVFRSSLTKGEPIKLREAEKRQHLAPGSCSGRGGLPPGPRPPCRF